MIDQELTKDLESLSFQEEDGLEIGIKKFSMSPEEKK
jgi:hypothetical protein